MDRVGPCPQCAPAPYRAADLPGPSRHIHACVAVDEPQVIPRPHPEGPSQDGSSVGQSSGLITLSPVQAGPLLCIYAGKRLGTVHRCPSGTELVRAVGSQLGSQPPPVSNGRIRPALDECHLVAGSGGPGRRWAPASGGADDTRTAIASGLKDGGGRRAAVCLWNAVPGISVEVMTGREHRGILECLVRSNRR